MTQEEQNLINIKFSEITIKLLKALKENKINEQEMVEELYLLRNRINSHKKWDTFTSKMYDLESWYDNNFTNVLEIKERIKELEKEYKELINLSMISDYSMEESKTKYERLILVINHMNALKNKGELNEQNR